MYIGDLSVSENLFPLVKPRRTKGDLCLEQSLSLNPEMILASRDVK